MHARKQTATCRSPRNNQDSSTQTERGKLANRQQCKSYSRPHTLMEPHRMLSKMSELAQTEKKQNPMWQQSLSYAVHYVFQNTDVNIALSQCGYFAYLAN